MADYVSSLNGSQMDQALLDMAEHTSEAYAVGERNGVPVDSSDVTYHNNARYYAQQAQSIAPASVTEAVRWDIAQTALTDANREQARANIAAGSSNYNLIDNSWFSVNQRNATSVSSGYYGADRWLMGGGTATFAIGSVSLSTSSNVGQRISLPSGTYTASVKLSDGTIISGTTSVGNTTATFISTTTVELDYFGGQSPKNFRIYNTSSSAVTIVAVKIEAGEYCTLQNDVAPDYGTELTRCIYSTADPTDTYANNGFGRTNPNLLDNWYLAGGGTGGNFPINQRGAAGSSISASGYFIDRWKSNSANNVGIFSGYVRILAGGGMRQYLPLSAIKKGVYTVSAMLEDGQVYSMTGTLDPAGTSGTWQLNKHLLQNVLWCGVRVDGGKWDFDFTSTNSANIVAVKAEAGTISTLANDAPPDYGTELAKCMRYFIRLNAPAWGCNFGIGRATNATTCSVFVPLPVPLRASPTVSVNGIGELQLVGNGGGGNATACSYAGRSESGVNLSFTASGLTASHLYTLVRNGSTSCYIDLSADL